MGTTCGRVANVRCIYFLLLYFCCAPVELQRIPWRSVAINKDRENALVIKESPAHRQALCLLIHPYSTAAKYVKVTSHHRAVHDTLLTQNNMC